MHDTIGSIAIQCQNRMEGLPKRIDKYDRSLGEDASVSKTRALPRKIQWHYSTSDELMHFWDDVQGDCLFLSMLLSVAGE